MKPDEFVKSFDFIVEAAMTWADCLKEPSKTYKTILIESTAKDAVKRAIKIWITAFLLTLLVQGWVYQLYGIPLSNIGFHLSSAIFVLATVVGIALSLQIAFRLFKLLIPPIDTFVAYTVYISAISPLTGLLVSPSLAQSLRIVKGIKAKDTELVTAVQSFYSQLIAQQDSPAGLISIACQMVLLVVSCLQLAKLFESLSLHSGVEKLKVFNAAAFGLVISLIPILVISLIQWMLIYSTL